MKHSADASAILLSNLRAYAAFRDTFPTWVLWNLPSSCQDGKRRYVRALVDAVARYQRSRSSYVRTTYPSVVQGHQRTLRCISSCTDEERRDQKHGNDLQSPRLH